MAFLAIPFVTAMVWVTLEWLFFLTKFSFMSLYTAWESLGMLAITSLIMAVFLLVVSLPFVFAAWLLGRSGMTPLLARGLGVLPAAFLGAAIMLLLVDNFTLTLFGWGVRNAKGHSIWVYRAMTAGFVFIATWTLYRFLDGRYSRRVPRMVLLASGLLSLIAIPLFFALNTTASTPVIKPVGPQKGLPNILILSGDGLSASHLSLYGYKRPTTPFMDSVQDEFLVAENQFSNASDTGGSVISLLSGKLPTTTRVIYPPDALRGDYAYQHLPGVLKASGYYNVDISLRHYADPQDLNMREGFDEANFRKLSESGGRLLAAIRRYPRLSQASQLSDRIFERIFMRFMHIWGNLPMTIPAVEVDAPDKRWVRDHHRLAEIRRVVNEAPRPFFLNVHAIGTHGKTFKPSERVWSSEEDRDEIWSVDGYDDAILDFDRMLAEVYHLLRDKNLLNKTILVVSSDHGFRHSATQRLPLLIRVPEASIKGRLGGNTQRLDIAPTLLDLLDIPVPDWMEGDSLVDPEFNGHGRFIFATGTATDRSLDGRFWTVSSPKPPWYTLGRLFLVHCDQAFMLELDGMSLAEVPVRGSTVTCDESLSADAALALMKQHLRERGYAWD